MGRVISFTDHAAARLRASESARADLIAFAHGHSGAVAAIHRALLAALDAPSLDALLRTVGSDWPAMLGVDRVALAVVIGSQGFRVDDHGVQMFARPIIDRAIASAGDVAMRNVARGHALFGDGAELVRAEALVRVDSPAPLPYGLLAIGHARSGPLDGRHGGDLLLFLGMSLAAMMRRWTIDRP